MDTILLADGDSDARSSLGIALGDAGYHVEFASNGDEVLDRLKNHKPDILILLRMLRENLVEMLREVRRLSPAIPVIVISGDSSPVNFVTTMNAGAIDCIPGTISHGEISNLAQTALQETVGDRLVACPMPGDREPAISSLSVWSRKVKLLLSKIGPSDVPVLLRGETGVGKEVLSRKLHAGSARANQPFLKLNCAALPSELVESELFGYERGAFTGAFKSTPGKFELANGGTLLLDEIGDMDFKLQAKLLHVIQDREFLRLGAKEPSKVDVRIMAATHCDLERAIVEGRFREDLYYRLNVIDIHIPPLRDRKDEILPLAEFFIRANATSCMPALSIPPKLADALLDHEWPGNIRELENVIKKYLVLRSVEVVIEELYRRSRPRSLAAGITAAHGIGSAPVHFNAAPLEQGPSGASVLENVSNCQKAAEADAIVAALKTTRWNRKQAAALLKIDYKALLYRMKKLGLGEKNHTLGDNPHVARVECTNSGDRAQVNAST
jgi:two-component system, NtrC family, response regulator AtoC